MIFLLFIDKVRRQPKAVKPKRMMKVESETIVYCACNNGTTALVSKEGHLFMFGKDTVHCDPTTGASSNFNCCLFSRVILHSRHSFKLTNLQLSFNFT